MFHNEGLAVSSGRGLRRWEAVLELPARESREGVFCGFGGDDVCRFAASLVSSVSRLKIWRKVLSGPMAGAG